LRNIFVNQYAGALRGGPGGTLGTGPGFFRGAWNIEKTACYIYTKMNIFLKGLI